jgi:hypothetical protein
MRCSFGYKKVKKLSNKTGLSIIGAMTRGGTGHRIDLLLDEGKEVSLFPDGSIVNFGHRWAHYYALPEKQVIAGLLEHHPMSLKERIGYELRK